jgi:N-acetylmuramoyl-L-alanine amidase
MAFTRPGRPVERVFVHCSASDVVAHDNVATMRKWHVEDNGWSGVGYHFFIRKSGELEAGRPLERTPAAQVGHNTGAIAICLHGLDVDLFTQEQFDTLIGLCNEIGVAYGEGGVTYHGHCEVSAKSCPVFDYREVLGLDENGERSRPATSQPGVAEAAAPASDEPVLRRSMSGPDVERLQELLNGAAVHVDVTGLFGQDTEQVVRAFQKREGLEVDGVVGPDTWGALWNAPGNAVRRAARPAVRAVAKAAAGRKAAKRKGSKKKPAKRKASRKTGAKKRGANTRKKAVSRKAAKKKSTRKSRSRPKG